MATFDFVKCTPCADDTYTLIKTFEKNMNFRMKAHILLVLIALLVAIIQNISRAKVISMGKKQGNKKLSLYQVHGTFVVLLIYVKQ